MDLDRFENTAAWLEHCDGMTRFAAETEAARRQGLKRHEVINAKRVGHSEGTRDNGSEAARKPADNLPGVQPRAAEEKGSVSFGHVQAGWNCLVLLALPVFGGSLL